MQRPNIQTRHAGFAVCSALAAALLGGFVSHAALARGETEAVSSDARTSGVSEEIAKAEKRVERSGHSASRRAELAHAYLAAGRFTSAEITFRDAIQLGDDSPRTALGLALASIGSGDNAEALRTLAKWRDRIPASDLGLALALAGQPAQGVAILTDVVRSGENTPKTRQNLAYAYALSGQWSQARIIAAQDVPGDQLDARLSDWARTSRPADSQERIASLLGTPQNAFDPGQPTALALGGAETGAAALAKADPLPQSFDEAPAAQVADASQELPALAEPQPLPALASYAEAQHEAHAEGVLAVAPETAGSTRFISRPIVQRIPEVRMGRTADASSAKSGSKVAKAFDQAIRPASQVASASTGEGTHLVQLGSFRTMEGAKRAWGIFVARDPRLKDHTMRITEAEVAGRRYFRVAAEGFDQGSARSMCSTVKSRGNGCLAYAESPGLPGALPAHRGSGPMRARR